LLSQMRGQYFRQRPLHFWSSPTAVSALISSPASTADLEEGVWGLGHVKLLNKRLSGRNDGRLWFWARISWHKRVVSYVYSFDVWELLTHAKHLQSFLAPIHSSVIDVKVNLAATEEIAWRTSFARVCTSNLNCCMIQGAPGQLRSPVHLNVVQNWILTNLVCMQGLRYLAQKSIVLSKYTNYARFKLQ